MVHKQYLVLNLQKPWLSSQKSHVVARTLPPIHPTFGTPAITYHLEAAWKFMLVTNVIKVLS